MDAKTNSAGERIKLFMPAIRNNILMVLAHKRSSDLLEREGKEKLAAEVLHETERALGLEPRGGPRVAIGRGPDGRRELGPPPERQAGHVAEGVEVGVGAGAHLEALGGREVDVRVDLGPPLPHLEDGLLEEDPLLADAEGHGGAAPRIVPRRSRAPILPPSTLRCPAI